jgi:hypothetical protein
MIKNIIREINRELDYRKELLSFYEKNSFEYIVEASKIIGLREALSIILNYQEEI